MPNRLANETSPYLLQHKDNPVDWFPWCAEAFELAREKDKPVFLSIGYSTCHWCHVMEHESFEDEEVARLMNDAFVAIKVDREERPDIDHTYMSVCQLIGEHCGWPLNVVLTPDKRPFMVGTYFPKESRGGRIGMLDLVPRIADAWANDRTKIDTSAESITDALKSLSKFDDATLDESWISTANSQLSGSFDRTNGGFGSRPKFPSPHTLMLLLRTARRGGSGALEMVTLTLDRMMTGGIHDHVGGGFHRYATDAEWRLPHFEKMLYDQALLAITYAEAWQVTGFSRYKQTAERILSYVDRDLKNGSLFFSAEDADSEGVEGKFYVWSKDEFDSIARDPAVSEYFDIREKGNFYEEATGKLTGDNILFVTRADNSYSSSDTLYPSGTEEVLERLLQVRAKRIRPSLDDKLLADWNALMTVAFAICGRIFTSGEYSKIAVAAGTELLAEFNSSGRLAHVIGKDDSIEGLLDDYAFALWAAIEIYQTTFEVEWLQTAVKLAEAINEKFSAPESGLLHFTPAEADPVLVRTTDINDGALPSGNAVAAWNLARLTRLTGFSGWEEKASAILQSAASRISRYPAAFTSSLIAADYLSGPASEIVLVRSGSQNEFESRAIELINASFRPEAVVHVLERIASEQLTDLAPYAASLLESTTGSALYVCHDFACRLPVTEVKELETALGS